MSPDKLVHMINQIARFYARRTEAEAAADISAHLRRFWDPRMRAAIIALVDGHGEGLAPAARLAVQQLATETTQSA